MKSTPSTAAAAPPFVVEDPPERRQAAHEEGHVHPHLRARELFPELKRPSHLPPAYAQLFPCNDARNRRLDHRGSRIDGSKSHGPSAGPAACILSRGRPSLPPMRDPFPSRPAIGLYLPDLELWLDSRRVRENGFVSHAHADHFARHRNILCSEAHRPPPASPLQCGAETGSIHAALSRTARASAVSSFSSLPAGHIFGSAMLHLTRTSDGASLLYTGDFKVRRSLTAEEAGLPPGRHPRDGDHLRESFLGLSFRNRGDGEPS